MTKKLNNLSDLGLVYSTHDSINSERDEDLTIQTSFSSQIVRVQLETKHRGGKAVSKIMGLQLTDDKLEEIAKFLKQKCGVGGSVKDGEILIQGDHVKKIIEILIQKGFKNTKKTGG
ncbi:MAG: translation initiation factor [Saprospiraceae bacterium]